MSREFELDPDECYIFRDKENKSVSRKIEFDPDPDECYIFRDKENNLLSISRKIIDKISADLRLKFLKPTEENQKVVEWYKDNENNLIAFSYKPRKIDVVFDNGLVSIYGIIIDKYAEIYDKTCYSQKGRRINITLLIKPYIRDNVIFKITEKLVLEAQKEIAETQKENPHMLPRYYFYN